MNERIRELAEQAWESITVQDALADEAFDQFDQKFAELIVRQMLDITDAHTEVFQTDRDRALIEQIKKSVKQHFGVEE